MNDLDFSFEASPWEAFLMTKGMGETISAVTLLSLMEGQDEQQLEDALQAMETGCMILDISGLPKVGGTGEAGGQNTGHQQHAERSCPCTETDNAQSAKAEGTDQDTCNQICRNGRQLQRLERTGHQQTDE